MADSNSMPLIAASGPGQGGSNAAPLRLSIVAPCFNEEGCLAEFHSRATATAQAVAGSSYEIVLVNDGSRDRTLAVMRGLADRDSHLVIVNLSRNHGHQLSLTAGLALCRGERVLTIDADLQDPPELLPEMMRQMDQDADVVFARRRKRHGETLFKRITAALFYRLMRRMVDVDLPTDVGDFRLMNRRTVDILNNMPERFRFIRGLVSWIGLRQTEVTYDRDPRHAGVTGYSFAKMTRFALDAITSFSVVPLRIASVFGCITAFFGLLMLVYTMIVWLRHDVVRGWASLATVVLTLGSVQLLVLGILGEYIGRLYLEAKHRPLFVIESVYTRPQRATDSASRIPAADLSHIS